MSEQTESLQSEMTDLERELMEIYRFGEEHGLVSGEEEFERHFSNPTGAFPGNPDEAPHEVLQYLHRLTRARSLVKLQAAQRNSAPDRSNAAPWGDEDDESAPAAGDTVVPLTPAPQAEQDRTDQEVSDLDRQIHYHFEWMLEYLSRVPLTATGLRRPATVVYDAVSGPSEPEEVTEVRQAVATMLGSVMASFGIMGLQIPVDTVSGGKLVPVQDPTEEDREDWMVRNMAFTTKPPLT